MTAYRIVSSLIGGLLVVAGGLKFHELLTLAVFNHRLAVIGGIIAGLQVIFGVWLLTGYLPRLTRCLTLGVFLGLLHIALFKALEKEPTCGCFGRVSVPPWGAIVVDGLAVAMLLAVRPNPDAALSWRGAWRPWAIGGAVALVIALMVPVIFRPAKESLTEPQPPSESDRELIERAAEAIATNYNGLPPIKLETTIVYRNSSKDPSLLPEFSFRNTYLVLGSLVRRDSVAENKVPAHFVIQDGSTTFQYLPDQRRGWVRGGAFVESHPLDPRCFGLNNPAHDVAAWLRGLTDVTTERSADALVVKGRDKTGESATVRLDKTTASLPNEIELRYQDGSLRSFAILKHQKHDRGWVLAKGEKWDYAPGAAGRRNDTGWYSWTTLTINRLTTEKEGPTREAFDPVIPAGATVWHQKYGRNFKLGDPLHREEMIDQLEQTKMPRETGWTDWIWAVLVGDVLFLVTCFVFRRRISF